MPSNSISSHDIAADWTRLRHASQELRGDREVVWDAVSQESPGRNQPFQKTIHPNRKNLCNLMREHLNCHRQILTPVPPHPPTIYLSVLKRCVPKTLAFAFGLRLRSKTRCFKTRVLGRRLPNGKPQERLRFRALRGKTLAFKKRIAIFFCDLKTSLGARACV